MRLPPSFLAVFLVALLYRPGDASASHAPPRLIVQITFDQLRADLLERYRPAFRHGFDRVLKEGHWIRKGEVAHGLTTSFPGHTTLASGVHPARHGLTANEWWVEEQDGRWTWIDVARDGDHSMLGEPDRTGSSPLNILRPVLADWIKAGDRQSKTVALSSGAPVAVAYGGRRPDALYWYDPASGSFTTSTYYVQAPHEWVARFNRERLPRHQVRTWDLSVPEEYRSLARPDGEPYEAGGVNNVFPHDYAAESRNPNGEEIAHSRWFAGTPMKDDALFALAAAAIDAEALGQRGHTDYLAVAADATDAVGHRYGPSSLEQLDTLLRLDRALGRFLDHLDRTVGRGNYVVGISADHGVTDPPEETGRRRITNADLEALLDRVEKLAETHSGPREALANAIADELKRSDFIADAYSEERLAAPSDDPFVRLYQHSFRPGRTPDFPLWTRRERPHHPARYGVVVRFEEGMVFDNATGIHGSPYPEDRSVPIIFYGAGAPSSGFSSHGRTIDVAPTLAALGGLSVPGDLDGKSLIHVQRKGRVRMEKIR